MKLPGYSRDFKPPFRVEASATVDSDGLGCGNYTAAETAELLNRLATAEGRVSAAESSTDFDGMLRVAEELTQALRVARNHLTAVLSCELYATTDDGRKILAEARAFLGSNVVSSGDVGKGRSLPDVRR